MRHLRLLLVLSVTLGLSLTAVPRAAADDVQEIPWEIGGGSVALSFEDFRFPSAGCHQHTGVLAVHASSDTAYKEFRVDLDLTVTRDGEFVGEWTDTRNHSGTYFPQLRLCHPALRPGSYTISGSVIFWDWNADPGFYPVYVSDTFDVLPPHASAVTIRKAPHRAHGWKVKGVVKYDGRPWSGKRTYLQVKRPGAWRNVASKKTNSRGRVAFAHTPPRGAAKRYRLYVKPSAGAPAKASRTIRLRRR